MRRYIHIPIKLLLPLLLLTGCLYEESRPPDICGIYTGTRDYTHFKDEVLVLDIQTVKEKGITGIISYENDTSFYSCKFKGEWHEDDSSVEIFFDEIEVITRINFYSAPICSYSAVINKGDMNGTFSYSNRIYGFSAAKQITEVVSNNDTENNMARVED